MALIFYSRHVSSFYLPRCFELCIRCSHVVFLVLFCSSLQCSQLQCSRSPSLSTHLCKDSIRPSWAWAPDQLSPRPRSYSARPSSRIGGLCCVASVFPGTGRLLSLLASPCSSSLPAMSCVKLFIVLTMCHEPQPPVISVRLYWTKSRLRASQRR